MRNVITLPFTYEDYDLGVFNTMIYYNVTFIEDFGCIPKGCYDNIFLDNTNGEIEVYNSEDEVLFTQKFKGIPINE